MKHLWLLCAALCVVVGLVDGAPLPEDPQVAANAKFANNAIKHIRDVQADLKAMTKAEKSEIADSKNIKNEVNAVPNDQPGKFAQEQKALGAQAKLIEQNAGKGISLEKAQQTNAVAALKKTNALIKNFATAGIQKQLGETAKTPEEVALQAANAKAALGKLKEVSSVLSTGTQTSHTQQLFTDVDKEAKLLEDEATAKLGETLDDASPLAVDAAHANFNAVATKASKVAIAKQNAKVHADKAAVKKAVARADHKKLVKKETAQLRDILKKAGQASVNEKASVKEVTSLWQKLN